jgi:hypothetical protein
MISTEETRFAVTIGQLIYDVPGSRLVAAVRPQYRLIYIPSGEPMSQIKSQAETDMKKTGW